MSTHVDAGRLGNAKRGFAAFTELIRMVSKILPVAQHQRELTNIRGAADFAARTVVVSSALGLRSGEADCRRYGEEKLDVQNHLREVRVRYNFVAVREAGKRRRTKQMQVDSGADSRTSAHFYSPRRPPKIRH